MTEPSALPEELQFLLTPRPNLPWPNVNGFLPPWAKPVLIENEVTRLFKSSILDQESEERKAIRGVVEDALVGLLSQSFRFWMAEYDFVAKMLNAEQLAVYAPGFVQLACRMPKKLIFSRRMIVANYLKARLLVESSFVQRQKKKFVRSCVLFYPSHQLFQMSDRFCLLVKRSVDQSFSANRKRVIMSVRALQLLSNVEICARYKKEEEYFLELSFLQAQCRYFQVNVSEIYRISGDEVRNFWAEH